MLLPNRCGYIIDRYQSPVKREILLIPARGIHPSLSHDLYHHLSQYLMKYPQHVDRLVFASISQLYPNHYEYSDLVQHPAMVILPYQVSFMSLFEYYRMGIPLFVPSLELLSRWHWKRGVLSERTWDRVFGSPQSASKLPRHPNSSSVLMEDPNNEYSLEAIQVRQ